MPWIDSLDWTDLNSLRRYPLREGLSALSDDKRFSIPDTLIVDFALSASSDVSRRFYISRIFNKLAEVIIELSDNLGSVVGTVQAAKSTHTEDADYAVFFTDRYTGANGKMTIGKLDDLLQQPAGNFTFTLAATEFEPRTIVPGLQGIDRITFIDNIGASSSLSGDVVLTARSNLNFVYSSARVFLDAGDNLGLSVVCNPITCVQSINGVIPDPTNGNISLLGTSCLKVYSSAQYTVDFEDSCCTPCSGCDDLETLTTRLTSLENKFLDLKGSYNNVNAQLTTYLSTVNSNCDCPT